MSILDNCTCSTGMGELGKPNCIKTFGRPYRLIFVNKRDSSGDIYKIPAATAIDQTFIDTAVQNLNTADRWRISPPVENFLSAKDDPQYQDYDNGDRKIVRDNRRTFTGMFEDADSVFLEQLETTKCAGARFFIATDENVLLGQKNDSTGDLYPMTMSELYAKLDIMTGDAVQDVSFVLDLPVILKDTQLMGRMDVTGDLINAEGLYPMTATLSGATTSTLDITLVGNGSYGNSEPFVGLEATDLSAYDVTDSSAGTIASVAATATDGKFTVTFTGATSGNTMRLSPTTAFTAKGYYFTPLTEDLA